MNKPTTPCVVLLTSVLMAQMVVSATGGANLNAKREMRKYSRASTAYAGTFMSRSVASANTMNRRAQA